MSASASENAHRRARSPPRSVFDRAGDVAQQSAAHIDIEDRLTLGFGRGLAEIDQGFVMEITFRHGTFLLIHCDSISRKQKVDTHAPDLEYYNYFIIR